VPFRTIAERLDMSLGAVQKSVRRSQKLADAMATGQPGDVLAAGDDLGVLLEAASRGGALARHRSVSATSSSGPPGSVGLACRPVGALRRHLMKHLQFMRGHRRRVRHCPRGTKRNRLAELKGASNVGGLLVGPTVF
jgi:hypothetical protein